MEFLGEGGGGGEAAGRVFLQALQAERVEVGGDLAVELRRRRRVVVFDLFAQQFLVALGTERTLAGEELEQDDSQGPEVGAAIDVLALPLFRRTVRGRAARRTLRGQLETGFRVTPGQAEVHHMRLAVVVDQNVERLQIAMDHARLVSGVERLGHFGTQLGHTLRSQRPALFEFRLQHLGQVCAVNVFAGNERPLFMAVVRSVADLEHGDDIGMLQLRRRLSLPNKILLLARFRKLECDVALQLWIVGQPDYAEASVAEQLLQLKASESFLVRRFGGRRVLRETCGRKGRLGRRPVATIGWFCGHWIEECRVRAADNATALRTDHFAARHRVDQLNGNLAMRTADLHDARHATSWTAAVQSCGLSTTVKSRCLDVRLERTFA